MRLIQVAEYKLWIVVSCKFVRKARRSTRLIISKFLADGSWLIADSREVPGSSLIIFTPYLIPHTSVPSYPFYISSDYIFAPAAEAATLYY